MAEKIEWLRKHDKQARQIALNGYIFGQSYLRLEDFYCYIGSMLYEFGHVPMLSEALVPYNATLVV